MKRSKGCWLIVRFLLAALFLLTGIGQPVQADAPLEQPAPQGLTPGSAKNQTQVGAIRFERLSVEDGLSQSTVWAILQDSQGFMWFGTEDGLNKYDGYAFTVYLHDAANPDTISDSTVYQIFEDTNGDLWFGTASGLDRFIREDETFEHYLYDPQDPKSLGGTAVSVITEDEAGNLWVGTQDGGISRYNRSSATFTRYQHNPEDPDSLISNTVHDLALDSQGMLWVATDAGLDMLNPKTGNFKHYASNPSNPRSLSDEQVWTLEFDRYGFLWIGTEDGGLNRLNPLNDTFTRYQHRPNNPYTLASNYVRALFEDNNGRMWVGGRTGLHMFVRGDDYFVHYRHDPNDRQSLSNDYILSFYHDRSGVLWIGTLGGGVSKYVQAHERFTLYQHRPNIPNSLSNDLIYAIHEDDEGAVWVGTMDGGLNRLDPEAGTFYSYQNVPYDFTTLSSNDVRAIYEDRHNILWIGTNGGGLNRLNRDTGRFRRFTYNENKPNSLSDNRITALFEDSHGNFWVGTRAGGLNKMDRKTNTFTYYRNDPLEPNSLSSDYVRVITEDSSGNLWVGTNDGLNVMDPKTGTFKHYLHDPQNPLSLSNNRVLSILQTPDGYFWIGTLLGGLNRFDPRTQTFQHYTMKQGLPSDAIYGILEDNDGNLWISTNRGLSRFDPQEGTFRNYDKRDGLQSYEFSPGAYFKNSRGRMYFGGVQGFNAFDPKEVRNNPTPPPVVITAFKKFNQTERKDLKGGETIELSYQDNFISFEFAALDYSLSEKNEYAYKLDGFDKEWVQAGTRRYASYTNLRGGTYVFRVIGSNQDGVWNREGATLTIVIIPPIWERWWFIGSLALLLAGSVFAGYRLRVMRIQNQNRQLEQQVRERTREIERRREVAEGLREIMTIINSNRSLKESLDCIVQQAERLMGAGAVVIFRCSTEEQDRDAMVYASNLPSTRSQNRQVLTVPNWITQPLLHGATLSVPDLEGKRLTHPEIRESAFGSYGALLAVPLLVNDQSDGGLVLLYQRARPFSEEDLKMALSFANHTALAIANAQLRVQAEEIAVSAERSRLARDLHDAVTQTLFATSLIAEVLPRLWERSPEMGKQKLAEIRELTRGALAEMRTLLMELRPTALEDVPLRDLLQQLSEAFIGRARVPVQLEVAPDLTMPSNVKIGYYRIVQEALNNIQKHARATQVHIQLAEYPGRDNTQLIELTIQDNGIGFDRHKTSADHFGLGIMEERAQSIGARYTLESCPGQGTTIQVVWEKE